MVTRVRLARRGIRRRRLLSRAPRVHRLTMFACYGRVRVVTGFADRRGYRKRIPAFSRGSSMDVGLHSAQRGRARAKARRPFTLPSGFELLMFALLGAAVLDAALVTWLLVRGVAG